MRTYLPHEVSRLLGITYRQLGYWDDTGFVTPSSRPAGRRRYTVRDVVVLALVAKLRSKGYSIQNLRRVIPELLELLREVPVEVPMAELVVLLWGTRRPAVIHGTLFGRIPDQSCMVVHLADLLVTE